MKKLALVLLLGLTAQAVSAKTVFSCQMKNGKQLSLSQVGNQYEYKFGKPSKPELVFRNGISDVFSFDETYSATGTGYFNLQFEMRNGAYSYVVGRSEDRRSGEKEASVEVFKNGKSLATVNCKPNTIYENADVYTTFERYGKLH